MSKDHGKGHGKGHDKHAEEQPVEEQINESALGGLPPQPAPPFDGSTFAPAAALVPPTAGLPGWYVTAPDEDTACRFAFVDDKGAELGWPADYCRLYVWDATLAVFGITDPHQVQAAQSNAFPQNHPFNAPIWQGQRYGEKMANGNLEPIGILPNTLTLLYGTTLDQFKALIAAQTKDNYNRTPYAIATSPPQPIGG